MILKRLNRDDSSQHSSTQYSTVNQGRTQQSYRKTIAIGALIAFALNLGLAQYNLMSADDVDASAIQIIQLWVPHIYYAILITGITVTLYSWTRSSDPS